MNPIPSNGGDSPPDEADTTHFILGDDHVGTAIAEELRANGSPVAVVSASRDPTDFSGVTGDPSSLEVLSESGIDAASAVIVATRSDRRNLLIAQLVRVRFGTTRVIALVNDPDRLPAFEAADHESVCVTTVLSEAVGEAL